MMRVVRIKKMKSFSNLFKLFQTVVHRHGWLHVRKGIQPEWKPGQHRYDIRSFDKILQTRTFLALEALFLAESFF